MKRILAALVASALLSVAVVPALAGASSMMGTQNIVQVASSAPQFSTLVKLVKTAGLVKALSGSGKLTVFAPTNAAFAKVPKATLNKLAHNKKLLTKVLEYHVVKGALTAAKVEKRSSLTTLEGSSLSVRVRGGHVFINKAEVIKANIAASNGIIHAINGVLIPAS